MTSCAVSEHGNLHSVIEFYKAMKKENIKPIIGMESYITEDEDGLEKANRTKDNYHMLLIAKDNEGLSNLFRLSSLAFQNNFYYRPRISKKNLEKYSKGLIATSACLGGHPASLCTVDESTKTFNDDGRALAIAKYYNELFEGNYYLELQDNQGMWEQKAWNKWILDNAKPNNLKVVMTADAHYLKKEDSETHALIMAMQLGKTLAEYNAGSQMKYGDGFFIRSPEEMLEASKRINCEEAFWNTTEISKECNISIDLNKPQMPIFNIESEPDYPEFLNWKEKCSHPH